MTAAAAHNLINGKPVPAGSGATMERRSPVDGTLVATLPRSDAADVAVAVKAARAAWRPWAATSPVRRGDLLRDFAQVLEARGRELIDLVRAETGKPERDLSGELGATREITYFLASEARRMYGRTMPSATPEKRVRTERAPIGVAGLVVAANTPLPNYAWKVVPALLCGNTVVLKPSEHTPLSAQLFVELLHEVGVPAGAANLIQGAGPEAGAALVAHSDVDLVSFTGGSDVGRQIARTTGARLAKTCLELGGRNPLVVCADADLDRAARDAAASAFTNAGQRCAAGSRIIVDRSALEGFLDRFLSIAEGLKVGGPGADLGPLISPAHRDGVLDQVNSALGRGATLMSGGTPRPGPGAYLEPTVLLVEGPVDPMDGEVFGPVAIVYPVDGFAEALALADATEYGLTASVHTRDMDRAQAFVDGVQVGMVVINGPTYGSEPHTPFGGFRASGNGFRECGTEVLDFYSDWKAIHTWTSSLL